MISSLSLFDDFFDRRLSVYVISDSQLAEYKRKQAQAEIAELNRLIDGHKQSIERLEATVNKLREEYPEPSK
jgi:septal ring factor EnvC (AmiA/AmiB activator)